MQRMTITVPRQYNDGCMVPVETIDRIDSDIVFLFGGYSCIDVYGQWTDESGEVYQDESFRYEILLSDNARRYKDLKTYAHELCRILDQKCILTTCESVQVDFVE